MEQKKVLLIGGTGAMGMYTIPELLKLNYHVFVTSRKKRDSDNPSLTYLVGDGHDINWLELIAEKYFFESVVDFMLYSYEELKPKVLRLQKLGKQYMYSSSYRVYADCESFITEESPRKIERLKNNSNLADDHYGISKALQENLLLQSELENYTILRPGMTFSRNRFQYGAMDNFDIIRTVRGAKSALPETMRNTFTTLTYGKDVGSMISRLVGNPKALGEVINVTSDQSYTWEEISGIFNTVFGTETQFISDKLYTQTTNQWRTMIDRRFNRRFSTEKVERITGLDFSAFPSLEEALREAWKESNHQLFYNAKTNWKVHADFDFLLDTRMSLLNVNERNQTIYLNELEEKKSEIKDIDENCFRFLNSYWKLRKLPWNPYIELIRKNGHLLGKAQKGDNRWISYYLGNSELRTRTQYKLTIRMKSNVDAVLNLLITGGGKIQKLPARTLIGDEWTTLEYFFTPVMRNLSYLTFTASDFILNGSKIEITEITIKESL